MLNTVLAIFSWLLLGYSWLLLGYLGAAYIIRFNQLHLSKISDLTPKKLYFINSLLNADLSLYRNGNVKIWKWVLSALGYVTAIKALMLFILSPKICINNTERSN